MTARVAGLRTCLFGQTTLLEPADDHINSYAELLNILTYEECEHHKSRSQAEMARKKHVLTVQEYEIYQKIHGYEEPVEVEEGKIRREKSNYVEKRNKGKSKIKQALRNIKIDISLADEEDFFDEEDFVARRELSNARVHKQRIKGIRKFEEEAKHEQ